MVTSRPCSGADARALGAKDRAALKVYFHDAQSIDRLHRLVFAAGGSLNCKALKQTLADARRRRHEAQRREQQELERAEREITSFALILCDKANPPCRTVEIRPWFDWAEARRAVAETKFWDACCACAEKALTDCLKSLTEPCG